MKILNLERLRALRAQTFHLLPGERVTNPKEALDFINKCGFAFFWPVKGIDLPSLWVATAGERPVPDAHDDPGHITWRWKDEALDQRIWYYGKILRRRATFISMATAPYFYVLTENYGSMEDDHLLAYESGRLTQAAKQVYEALLDRGPLDTISLRKEARLQNAGETIFNRALEDLQKDFKILPVGIAEAGAWRYAYRYEITARHYPELPKQARQISEADARQKLCELALLLVGAVRLGDISKLFGWSLELARRTTGELMQSEFLVGGVIHPLYKGDWLTLPSLTD